MPSAVKTSTGIRYEIPFDNSGSTDPGAVRAAADDPRFGPGGGRARRHRGREAMASGQRLVG